MKALFLLLSLVSMGAAQIPTVSLPHVFATDSTPRIRYVYENDTILANRIIQIRDTVNGDSVKTLVKSLGSLRLTLDNDDNGTAHCLAMTHNGATDTIAKFCDDLSTKAFGALSINGRTTLTDSLIGVSQRLSGNLAAVNGSFGGTLGVTGVATLTAAPVLSALTASLPVFTNGSKALVSNAITGSGNVVMSASPTLTGTIAAANGTFSGTLGVTGLHTASGGISISGGTAAAGRIVLSAADGVLVQANTGSIMDFALASQSGLRMLSIPTGTTNIEIGRTGSSTGLFGSVTIAGTSAHTGTATFTAAPVFSSVTASQFLLVDGSKALTSVAGTGSGSVVRATSPTITTPTFSGTVASGLTASRTVVTDGSGNLAVNTESGTGPHLRQTSPTLVTPALGAATATSIVASGNITADSLISAKFYEEGSFTATLRGCATDPTGTAYFTRVGKQVTLALPYLSCTSDSAGAAITGSPASIHSARRQGFPVNFIENSTNTQNTSAGLVVDGAAVRFFSLGAFSASGTRTLYGNHGSNGFTTITYTLQ